MDTKNDSAGAQPIAGWTAGPWRVDPNANCDVQTADGRLEIATTHQGVLRGGKSDAACARANARLIAAAPTMAEFVRKRALAGDADAHDIWKSLASASLPSSVEGE